MKLNRKLVLVLALVLSVAMATGGTLAYLTDRDSAANVFTMGNVKIKLNEEFEQGAKLLPGQIVDKGPTIRNTGSEDAYVWMTVAYPKAFAGIADEYSTEDEPSYCETWQLHGGWFSNENSNWTMLDPVVNETEGRIVRTFLYNEPLTAGGSTDGSLLFDQIGLCYHIDITPEGDMYHVVNGNAVPLNWNINTDGNPVVYVSAYAIQADAIDSYTHDDEEAYMAAYRLYNEQWGDNGTEWGSTTFEPDTAWYDDHVGASEYYIGSASELFGLVKLVNEDRVSFTGKTIKLTENIDLLNQEWTPIGQTHDNTEFYGTFDGQNHTIKNLMIDDPDTTLHHATGLFGYMNGSVINLKIDGAEIKGHHNVGTISGYQQFGEISGCTVENVSITCSHATEDACGDKAGGIVGVLNHLASISNSSVKDTTIEAGRDAGQVIGGKYSAATVGENVTADNVSVTRIDADKCSGANIENAIYGRVI